MEDGEEKSGGTGGTRRKGEHAGQRARATNFSLSNRRLHWQLRQPHGKAAWQRRLTWQRSPGQGSICSAGDVN